MDTAERTQRTAALQERMAEHILVLDGAMGTAIQARDLSPEDYGGADLEGCNEHLVRTRPDVVEEIHRAYLEAGCDVVETNTFGATPLVLAEYGLGDEAEELNREAARIARAACDAFSSRTRLRFVAGSMGPTTRSLSVTGGVTFEELAEHFRIQARGLVTGGVDFLLIETAQDTRNVKAALIGVEQVFKELGLTVPVAVSGTIEPTGTMLAGQGVEAFYTSLMHWPLLYVGLNCATGPEFMTDHIRSLAGLAQVPVGAVPNAGLPDEDGRYHETPEAIARVLERFMASGWLNVVGGCCGTTPDHIRAIVEVAGRHRPRRPLTTPRTLLSGIDFLEVSDENRPVIVGERTNVLGSRKFKRLIAEGAYDAAAEIGRRQVKGGAQVIDVGLADPDRDEAEDMARFLAELTRKVRVPLMIDSTDPKVIERALTWCQGKSVINSANLENGEERLGELARLARKYGAALIVGCIDEDPEQGMAVTRERKLAIARRARQILLDQHEFREEDIIFDPLVFPCGTGAPEYVGSAVETIEGIRLIKEEMPLCRTVLGISNVSFGLPPAGREVLNAVFLYHCTLAGLDMAIVNAQRLERYASIPEEERRMAEDLLFNRGEDPVGKFAAHFKEAGRRRPPRESLSLDERLVRYIVEGVKEGLVEDLDAKLAETDALSIINGPLMEGMAEVGRLFNNNELIVAEVLQSAEAMKAAVDHLKPHLDRSETSTRGRMLLATVKGDVHDIGKNLVDIIFSNNGYEVINLGIKVPPEALIQAFREHDPDLIGLSGLLVKSARQMVVTAQDLEAAGIQVPLLVGGAALSRKFAESRIASVYQGLVVYCRDAMDGLELANRVVGAEGRDSVASEIASRKSWWEDGGRPLEAGEEGVPSRSDVSMDVPRLRPPDRLRHLFRNLPREEIFGYVNLQTLYGKHLGLRGSVRTLAEKKDPKFQQLKALVDEVLAACHEDLLRVDAVYRFFEAEPEGDRLHLYWVDGSRAATFEFPRQGRKPHLCLSDYCLPPEGGQRDTVALFVTTAGSGVRIQAEAWKEEGEYLKSHVIQALAIEMAEAAAEWLHQRLRAAWGIEDPEDLTMEQMHRARYQGKRYSFGYPACPNLADQVTLFELLKPEDIGVSLTDGYMMEPEASVSAIVFHHPEARYFSAL